jgi:hypothetical protein
MRHRRSVRHRDCSPYIERHILVKKSVTKEKSDNWLWGRASQASSVSSIGDEEEATRSSSRFRPSWPRGSTRYRSKSRSRYALFHRRRSPSQNNYQRSHSRHYRSPSRAHRRSKRRSEERKDPCQRRRGGNSEASSHQEEEEEEEDEKTHTLCEFQHNQHSLPIHHHHHHHHHHHKQQSPLPIFAVPIKSSPNKMEQTDRFSYEEWCKRRSCVAVATESIAPKSSISNRSAVEVAESDHDNTYHYVAMREPGPQDAVVSFSFCSALCALD